MSIYANYDLAEDLKDLEYLIQESFSIIVGDFVRPKIIEEYFETKKIVKIRSNDNNSNNNSFPAPYKYFYICI